MIGLFKRFGFAAVVTIGLMLMVLVVAGKAVFSGGGHAAAVAQGGQAKGRGPGGGPGGGAASVLAVEVARHSFSDAVQALGTAQARGVAITAHTAAYPDRSFTGAIADVDSRVDPTTRTARVRAIIAGIVAISAFASLSLSPMMCSKLIKPVKTSTRLSRAVDAALNALRASYRASLAAAMNARSIVFAVFAGVLVIGGFIFTQLSSELTPPEDRGMLVVSVNAPEGAGFEYTSRIAGQVEAILLDYVESGEAQRVMMVAPGFGDQGANRFSSAFARIALANWEDRSRSAADIETELNQRLSTIPGATIPARVQGAFQGGGGGGGGEGASIVLMGSTYEQLAGVASRMIESMRDSPNFQRPRMNYEPTSPRVLVEIDRERAAALGVSVQAIARTLKPRWVRSGSIASPIAARNIMCSCRLNAANGPTSPISPTNTCALIAAAIWFRCPRWSPVARWATPPSAGA